MKYFVALATLVAAVSAQNPPGCSSNSGGTFVISPINITGSPSQFDKRQVRTICGSTPIVTLQDGVLKDQQGRTGNVVANSQFQFDSPLQNNAIYTDGFSICQNSSLAVGGSAIFYQCLSGTFYNLYQQSQGKQCNAIYINTVPCESDGSQSASVGSSSSAPTPSVAPPATSAPTSVATTPAAPATPVTPTTVAVPYPVGNTTTAGSTGTVSGGGAGPTTSSTTSPSPSPFAPGSGATTIVIGGKLAALIAAVGAFAMF